jgi:ParB-like chromosome segregation protein Spo0J
MRTDRAPSRDTTPRSHSPLAIHYLPIESLAPDPKNARVHGRRQLRQIAESIQTFGFNVPVLIDAERRVIAGHGRLEAAKRLGLKEVPTIRLEHLSEMQKQAFMIADNRLTEIASWDDRLLAEQLRALASVDLDFDIETIGFDMAPGEGMPRRGLASSRTPSWRLGRSGRNSRGRRPAASACCR